VGDGADILAAPINFNRCRGRLLGLEKVCPKCRNAWVAKRHHDGSLVGRAVALAQAGKPAARFAALEEIPASRIVNYQPYWAARGHLLTLLKRKDEAQQAFTRAAGLIDEPALREYLFKRSAGNI